VELAGLIHERTEGNPLFMVNAVDYLVLRRLIGEAEESWSWSQRSQTLKCVYPKASSR
jgi:predicted ATPase